MIEIRLDAPAVHRELGKLIVRLQHPRKLMAGIAAELLSETEHQFDREGDPKWKALSSSTIKRRSRKGHWPGKVLQVSTAGLAASVQTSHTEASATIGAGSGKSAKYAAIHQFGGQAGRGRKVTIPARPYLPIAESGSTYQLTPRAQKAIMAMALNFVKNGRPK